MCLFWCRVRGRCITRTCLPNTAAAAVPAAAGVARPPRRPKPRRSWRHEMGYQARTIAAFCQRSVVVTNLYRDCSHSMSASKYSRLLTHWGCVPENRRVKRKMHWTNTDDVGEGVKKKRHDSYNPSALRIRVHHFLLSAIIRRKGFCVNMFEFPNGVWITEVCWKYNLLNPNDDVIVCVTNYHWRILILIVGVV
jgi:hypothetical protein